MSGRLAAAAPWPRAAWDTWRNRDNTDDDPGCPVPGDASGILSVAAGALVNGGDNIDVHVPVFNAAGRNRSIIFTTVFSTPVAVWCLAGREQGVPHPETERPRPTTEISEPPQPPH
ncbi:hypothetical protein ABTW96_34465 [Nocardia beijingensis]|uniref:hypothetical protein n=1 Tax=Nocardia beijingensis TaxID=95162 RepID=UPI0033308732